MVAMSGVTFARNMLQGPKVQLIYIHREADITSTSLLAQHIPQLVGDLGLKNSRYCGNAAVPCGIRSKKSTSLSVYQHVSFEHADAWDSTIAIQAIKWRYAHILSTTEASGNLGLGFHVMRS